MEPQLSPIFDFVLLELIESVAIAGIIATAGLASVIFFVNTRNLNQAKKTDSANLILELLKPWRQDEFADIVSRLKDPKTKPCNEYEIMQFLNQMEDIAVFWKDKTLAESHVKEFFGDDIKIINENKSVEAYMKKWVDKNSNYYFVNIEKLVKKSHEWKI